MKWKTLALELETLSAVSNSAAYKLCGFNPCT